MVSAATTTVTLTTTSRLKRLILIVRQVDSPAAAERRQNCNSIGIWTAATRHEDTHDIELGLWSLMGRISNMKSVFDSVSVSLRADLFTRTSTAQILKLKLYNLRELVKSQTERTSICRDKGLKRNLNRVIRLHFGVSRLNHKPINLLFGLCFSISAAVLFGVP